MTYGFQRVILGYITVPRYFIETYTELWNMPFSCFCLLFWYIWIKLDNGLNKLDNGLNKDNIFCLNKWKGTWKKIWFVLLLIYYKGCVKRFIFNQFLTFSKVLKNILKNGPERRDCPLTIRRCSSQAEGGAERVSIGDITITVKQPKNVVVVPVKYIQDKPSQSVLHHLKWIMQKDGLRQDVFLIGKQYH